MPARQAGFAQNDIGYGGFTLLEVLIAITILAVGLVLVMEGMGRTQQALRISDNLVTASLIAENKLSEIRLKAEQDKKLGALSEHGKEILPGREFKWTEQAYAYSDPSLQDKTRLNFAQVALEWQETPQRRNLLKLESLILIPEEKQ